MSPTQANNKRHHSQIPAAENAVGAGEGGRGTGQDVAGRSKRQRQRVTIQSGCPVSANSTAKECGANCLQPPRAGQPCAPVPSPSVLCPHCRGVTVKHPLLVCGRSRAVRYRCALGWPLKMVDQLQQDMQSNGHPGRGFFTLSEFLDKSHEKMMMPFNCSYRNKSDLSCTWLWNVTKTRANRISMQCYLLKRQRSL
jgi:hypothetical protein